MHLNDIIGPAALLIALSPASRATAQGITSKDQLMRSAWDSSYTSPDGEQVRARIQFNGDDGTYDTASGQGRLSRLEYGFDTNPTNGEPTYQITGQWSYLGASGSFLFSSADGGTDQFRGRWTRGDGQGGPWTGRLITPSSGGAPNQDPNAARGQVRYGAWQFNDAKGYYFRTCTFPAGGSQYLILYPKKPQWVYWFNPNGPTGPVFWSACPTVRHPQFGDAIRNGKDLFLMATTKGATIDQTEFPDDAGANLKGEAQAKDRDGSTVDLGCPPSDLPADLP